PFDYESTVADEVAHGSFETPCLERVIPSFTNVDPSWPALCRPSTSFLPQARRGWPGQAHGCPAQFVLSCWLLDRDASARCAAAMRGAPCERLELEFGLRRFARW